MKSELFSPVMLTDTIRLNVNMRKPTKHLFKWFERIFVIVKQTDTSRRSIFAKISKIQNNIATKIEFDVKNIRIIERTIKYVIRS